MVERFRVRDGSVILPGGFKSWLVRKWDLHDSTEPYAVVTSILKRLRTKEVRRMILEFKKFHYHKL